MIHNRFLSLPILVVFLISLVPSAAPGAGPVSIHRSGDDNGPDTTPIVLALLLFAAGFAIGNWKKDNMWRGVRNTPDEHNGEQSLQGALPKAAQRGLRREGWIPRGGAPGVILKRRRVLLTPCQACLAAMGTIGGVSPSASLSLKRRHRIIREHAGANSSLPAIQR